MYTYLGSDNYEITVRLYRDCTSPSTGFPNTVLVQVKDSLGNAFVPSLNFVSALDSTSFIPSYLPCAGNPGICSEEGFYTTIVNLPPVTGGYHLYHQFCCRNSTLANVVNPVSQGISLYTYIPNAAVFGTNNSAEWSLRPPLFECQGYPMNYNYGATDADGDSLVFSYYTPHSDPNPTFPMGVATFTPVTWQGGYSATNPCGGPTLTMSNTGYITGIPPNIGAHAAGVRCTEYRNGVRIAEIVRDYPFFVISCIPGPTAAISGPTTTCYMDFVQFTNLSTNATTYHWDFGDPAITNDTSNLANPQWQYANPGTYTVTLVANPYTACSDTTTWVLTVQQVHAAYIVNDTLFTIANNQFTDSSWTSNGGPIVLWDWDFGDATSHSSQQNPTHVYASPGTYTVTLIVLSADGCLDTAVFTVFVDLFNTIQRFDQLPFTVYPNPGEGIFNVYLPFTTGTLRLTDLQGREIARYNLEGTAMITLNPETGPGTYFLQFISPQVKLVQKLVVK